MAYDINDLVIVPYRRASQPILSNAKSPEELERAYRNLHTYLSDEFRKLEATIATLSNAAPQVAFKEPDVRSLGMIRYAKSPWDPLGSGDAWVYWDGTSWAALNQSSSLAGSTWNDF